MDLKRYSIIEKKFPREILLLKSKPCSWGKCTFCDYILDNEENEITINNININLLQNITGKFKRIEIINSGNVFEIPDKTLKEIKRIIVDKNIEEIFLEAHWMFRYRLDEIRNFFNIPIIFKTGVETFDVDFREKILNKGFGQAAPDDIKKYFNSVCLLVGIEGQTKEMIKKDIEIANSNFEHFTVNIYCENSSNIKPDLKLIDWFYNNYKHLEDNNKCEILWHNTDFGVG